MPGCCRGSRRAGRPGRCSSQVCHGDRRPRPQAGAACRIRAEHLFLTAAGRSVTELQAKSRHARLAASVLRQAWRETSARITAEHDPAARGRSC